MMRIMIRSTVSTDRLSTDYSTYHRYGKYFIHSYTVLKEV